MVVVGKLKISLFHGKIRFVPSWSKFSTKTLTLWHVLYVQYNRNGKSSIVLRFYFLFFHIHHHHGYEFIPVLRVNLTIFHVAMIENCPHASFSLFHRLISTSLTSQSILDR